MNGCFMHNTDGFIDEESVDITILSFMNLLELMKSKASISSFVYSVMTTTSRV